MVQTHQHEHPSQWAAICSIAAKIGCTGETLRGRVRQAERDHGKRAGLTTDEHERMKALEHEVRKLRQTTRFCGRLRHILLRQSSAARSSHDAVHR